MKVALLDYTRDPENRIGHMAAICYDAKTDEQSNIRRARHCKDAGHLATLRFAYATINVSDISRICSHQMVRMAHAGILQKSQRYVTESFVEFVQPHSLADMPDELKLRWTKLEQDSRELYSAAIESGMRKEDARYALLHSATTELNLCLNFQGWRDFLRNRTASAAQWEVREVALEVGRQLAQIAPNVFSEYAA